MGAPQKEDVFDLQFPIVKNVAAKTIAQDIVGYDPNNPKDVARWAKIMGDMYGKIKEQFDAKGIPMPTIEIDNTPGPITYGIRTVGGDGNEIHRQINNEE